MTARPSPMTWSVNEPLLGFTVNGGETVAAPSGDWTIGSASKIESLVADKLPGDRRRRPGPVVAANTNLTVDLADLDNLDTAGALVLNRLFKAAGDRLHVINMRETHRILIAEVVARDKPAPARVRQPSWVIQSLEYLGRLGLGLASEVTQVLAILGGSTISLLRNFAFLGRFRFAAYVTHLQRAGLAATPIVALMSFLIGGILAQQGTFYFRRFGADLYVVDLTGMLTLRELGVLLTAIMVAGRSGSAITAELGSMKMREEMDALRVLGLDPVEVLILPRILALITALPLLTFIADVSAIFGAALDSTIYAGIPGDVFLTRLQAAVDIQTFLVGFSKAPFMALIIGLIAALEGMRVEGSAESLGQHTTQAVVKSIFLVILVDGIFAIFFSSIGV